MSKFICRNAECSNCGKIDEYFSNTYKMVDGHLVSNNAPCPKCGQIREEIVPGKDIPLSEKNIYLATYTMASPEERREMLKKMSSRGILTPRPRRYPWTLRRLKR